MTHLPFTPEELGEFLRHRRQAAGITAQRLADLLGAHENTILQIEAGKRLESFMRLLKALEIVGVEVRLVPRKNKPT